jgi:hypothetical protein
VSKLLAAVGGEEESDEGLVAGELSVRLRVGFAQISVLRGPCCSDARSFTSWLESWAFSSPF